MKQFRNSNFEIRISSIALFIVALALRLLVLPPVVNAQQAGKVHRLGLLGHSSELSYAEWVRPLKQELRELGYDEGKNVIFEARYADGSTDRLAALAAELVRLKVDIIITLGTGP